MNKRSLRTALMFSVLVFWTQIITMLLMGFITAFLFRTGIFTRHNRLPPLFLFALASIIIGTVLSKFVGQRTISKIMDISEATKQIASGNFDVCLDEESMRVVEFQEMAKNFNIMAKELANTEMFRNDFIVNVSHEFKTPLSAIEGYAMLLQKKGLSEEKRMEYTARILYNVKRLTTLTGNILLLSKLENQEIGIARETFCLDEQLRETILLFEEQWTAKNIELDIELDNADYTGNKELLSHVWQNIIGNAIKFAPQEGKVRVFLRAGTDSVSVAISDNGDGMDEQTCKRAFEKFYQADSSRAEKGNGLGLTLAKRIIDLHGGEITVISEKGKGSTFTVSLPLEASYYIRI